MVIGKQLRLPYWSNIVKLASHGLARERQSSEWNNASPQMYVLWLGWWWGGWMIRTQLVSSNVHWTQDPCPEWHRGDVEWFWPDFSDCQWRGQVAKCCRWTKLKRDIPHFCQCSDLVSIPDTSSTTE